MPGKSAGGMKCFVVALTAMLLAFLVAATAGALDEDIVLYFRFDEGEGNEVVDQSGNGNDGMIQGNPAWVEGMAGTALEFNGTDDYVEAPNSATLNITGAVTILAWIKLAPGWYPNVYTSLTQENKVTQVLFLWWGGDYTSGPIPYEFYVDEVKFY